MTTIQFGKYFVRVSMHSTGKKERVVLWKTDARLEDGIIIGYYYGVPAICYEEDRVVNTLGNGYVVWEDSQNNAIYFTDGGNPDLGRIRWDNTFSNVSKEILDGDKNRIVAGEDVIYD